MPGSEWVNQFIESHKNIISHRMCQNINRRRAAISEDDIKRFLTNLEVNKIDTIPPENIINYDETFMCDDPKGKKNCSRGM